MSLSNKVTNSDGTHLLTMLKLYKTSVLPRALFGCELLNVISKTDMQLLEVAQHFCLKIAHEHPALTRSDMVCGLIGISLIEAYIDQQKLRFLDTLCRTQPDDIVSKLFTSRFFHYNTCNVPCNLGFVPDIFTILNKYNIKDYIEKLINCCEFPDKFEWKRLCNKQILYF